MSKAHSDNSPVERAGNRVVIDVLFYAAARLLLVVVLSGAIYAAARLLGVTQFPIVVAVLFALIIAMPLGIWLFGSLRRRATAALAIAGAGNANSCRPGCAGRRRPARSPSQSPERTAGVHPGRRHASNRALGAR